ncbi:hypothetical protein AMATHDRAFT_53582 [Amanita thiersii Skay4041]|uniref:PH domain-containing protein n=1 Tax=Amanita thiersii Skay4041 TaxID=703135 RepID=A0A2A9P0F7_9AGAR|nr:hypothetical protein AMATHDRAFT_53582 [Amanita thiersii Skay4041]
MPPSITIPANSPLLFSPFSSHSPYSSKDKGKAPVRASDIFDSVESTSLQQHSNLSNHRESSLFHHAATSFDTPHTPSRLSTDDVRPSKNVPRKQRGSLFVAASDALGLKFSRRRTPLPPRYSQPNNMTILPGVIEITAHKTDAESEERERLREIAAQSLGITVDSDTRSISEATEEPEQDQDNASSHVGDSGILLQTPSATLDVGNQSHHNSNHSLASSPHSAALRSGSLMAHSKRGSIPGNSCIPPFPATVETLESFRQLSASLPKYHPPSNFRIFALSRGWRVRHLVLTSPPIPVTRENNPAVSYLHIFKSSAGQEKETDRLEINEDSVVFIAEEEVGGRKHVVKVGGRDESGIKKEYTEEGCRTMWFFQIADSTESQRWIATIKNVILSQRTIRAGLGLPQHTLGGIEPRGDMDVMLSIRQQGIITSPSNARLSTVPPQPAEAHYASSISSQSVHSHVSVQKSPPAGSAVAGIKSMFSRPRATSRATSFDSERSNRNKENEDSFVSMSSMLSKIRPSTADPTSKKLDVLGSSTPPTPTTPNHPLQRRIMNEPASAPAVLSVMTEKIESENAIATTSEKEERANKALSLGALPLQPPPRKRWTSMETRGTTAITVTDMSSDDGVPSQPGKEPPPSPRFGRFSVTGIADARPRAPSLQSVSTMASADNNPSTPEKSSITAKRSSRRWSRQSVLPTRSSPPKGPPPAIPASIHLQPHPYATEQSPYATDSPKSSISPFSKRTSASSALSAKSVSSTHSFSAGSRAPSAHRTSMPPPPKPAPTVALPLVPGQGPVSSSAPVIKPSFRESMTTRALRFSMIAPRPPPSDVLPLRPDEPGFKHRRRASSGSYFTQSDKSNPSSVSLIPISSSHTASATAASVSPFPPPTMPLPPTPPTIPLMMSTLPSPSELRQNLIKRRLRMLSAPSPAVNQTKGSPIPTDQSRPRSTTVTASSAPPPSAFQSVRHTTTTMFSSSPPATPIAEKITLFQNDPSFLQFVDTPTMPFKPVMPRSLPPTPDHYSEITSLSPPPRRGSRQIPHVDSVELETPEASVVNPKPPATEGEHRLISLSRPGSVVSLGIVAV